MTIIRIQTIIDAPVRRCFNLSRSIDVHMVSTARTHERAIAGVTSGLIGLHETVTWRAKHLGFYQQLTVAITAMEEDRYFKDTMVKGIFKSLEHEHYYDASGNTTVMTDVLSFEAPFGLLGIMAEKLLLHRHMKRFLTARNNVIKKLAESDAWRKYIDA
ncbi:MAG: SRPBCC family protein [Chitinophagales bacterium]|nr:SRPBCC family protein [Chitinophagales bacterium]